VSLPDFLDVARNNRSFADMAALFDTSFHTSSPSGDGMPERLMGSRVSTNFFRFLGVKPVLGRDFESDENMPGKDHNAILGYG
jgi:putative ABC transport system permease protein